ncbi:MAG TPA: iron chelate uptake ABC transporter family permease subunit [Ktedonobacterales bacterium]|nr:iron chelate uptake ABC transporter family permease subunit [Ktedonobacterales bacterium]
MQTTRPTDSAEQPTPLLQTLAGSEQAAALSQKNAALADESASRRRWKRAVIVLPILCVGLLIALVLATTIGSVPISAAEIVKMTLNSTGLFHFRRTWGDADEIIIFQLRLPHVIGAALVGAALAVGGVLFQGLLRNPLADPYLIGISAGSGLGITIGFALPASLLFFGFGQIAAFAFVGAIVAVVLVYWLARVGGRTPVVSLLLAGMVVTALMNAIQALLLYLYPGLQLRLRSVIGWLWGGIAVQDWGQVGTAALLILSGILLALSFSSTLNALALGEEGATYLGVNVERQKTLLIAVASLLTAAAVTIAGLVGFVGLVVPHALRLVIGPGHRLLLPASALGGALFLVIADLLARSLIAPSELPLGVLTALVGGPFFLYLLRRSGRDYRW